MGAVTVVAWVPSRTASECYPVVCDFARYPELTDAVLRVEIDDLGNGRTGATWDVRFRRGILRWSEEDRFDPELCRVDFSMLAGDLEHMSGYWHLLDSGDGCELSFFCDFDMGIPTLAHIIEPIAEQTLRDNVVRILAALFPAVRIRSVAPDDEELATAGGGR
jgi:ribosome-associated toxin RatA of RatAB toxin-antitoxin module